MCDYTYSGNYAQMPSDVGKKCPYPEIYKKFQTLAFNTDEVHPAIVLPLDCRGVCIFHSHEVAWKRASDFAGEFLRLLQWLEKDDSRIGYDFAEFFFVGSPPEGPGKHLLRVDGISFRRHAFFMGATFLDSVTFEGVVFQEGANFRSATFAGDLIVKRCRIKGLDFIEAKVEQSALFSTVEFASFALFHRAKFAGAKADYVARFEDSRFEGITDFSGSRFSHGAESGVSFSRVHFEDFTDFRQAKFNCRVVFSDTSFAFETEFIDTTFDIVRSSARYRGSAVEFNQIAVMAKAVVVFISTDLHNKIFKQDVQMSFDGDPQGIIRFENANLSRFSAASLERINRLAKMKAVEIGPGCIKYRFRTDLMTIVVSQGNAPLILELCQTFTNYFTVSSGFNLGLEIVDRDQDRVSFFYFSDENISDEIFAERLAKTEQGLWNLLSIRSDEQLLVPEPLVGEALTTAKQSSLVNAVDGVSALLGTFFRVGVRLALGVWKEADTKALLSAIRFNERGAEERAKSLHQTFVDQYTGRRLLGFNHEQNKLLVPMPVEDRKAGDAKKIRILFLGANSMSSPLDLEREVKKIQTSLRLSKERENLELKQEWAVTTESLMQAMLDEDPTIVHFSGHGEQAHILLQDEVGELRAVSGESLSNLFKLFKDKVRCVVLNACYSEHQALEIRRHIPYVIGVTSSIYDTAGIAFSVGFYKALGAGKDVPFAFEMGKASIELEGGSSVDELVVLL